MKNETLTAGKVGDVETFLQIRRYAPACKAWLRTSALEHYTQGDELGEQIAQRKVFAAYRKMIKADRSGILKSEKIRLVRVTSEILTPEIDPNSL